MSGPQSIRSSIPDTELGLTQGEIQLLRTQQQLMAQRSHQNPNSERGRGNSRVSQPSSRAASAASSTGPGNRVILDPRHLQALQTHLDNVMRSINSRITEVSFPILCREGHADLRHSLKMLRNDQSIPTLIDMVEQLTPQSSKCSACGASLMRLIVLRPTSSA